ncbi:MAG: 2-dehydropantoate 2-reductase N-terminal domain-containing protein, partial [Clostridia bacterium]|nr:2-dehydropantoate 2-reductase N-terminal domain-containing protein [Clostridia bacterium]
MKSSVLGCGRWGTYIAHYLNTLGHDVLLWGRSGSERLGSLVRTKKNEYLSLDETIELSSSLFDAVQYSDRIFISIDSQQLRNLAQKLHSYDISHKIIILCMKGLENNTGMR